MACVEEILRLCRLCLQKQDVKTPIFEQEGDIKEIFLKITTCLPVKVSREDQLPKKICDDCTGKLDSFYNFWKTTVDSEKQLLNWLSHIDKIPAPVTGVKKTESLELKQEIVDPPEIRSEEDVSSDAVNDSGYPQTHSEKKRDTLQTNNPSVSEEPPPKRARRSVTLKKQIQTSESDEDDDFEGGADPKVEEGDSDNSDDADDPGFGDEKNDDEDHANIDDQPGPSGVGKSTADQSLIEIKLPKGISVKRVKSSNTEHNQDITAINSMPSKRKEDMPTKSNLSADKPSSKIIEETSSDLVVKTKSLLSKVHSKGMMERQEKTSITLAPKTTASFLCALCKSRFQSLGELNAHFASPVPCHVPSLRCPICEKVFTSKNKRTVHMYGVHSVKPKFPCLKCNKSFASPMILEGHMGMMHTKYFDAYENGIRCKLCDFTCANITAIQKHVNKQHVHLSTNLCDICGKIFFGKQQLAQHKHTHSEAKNYVCQKCSKCFKTSQTLNRHKQLHEPNRKLFSCERCGRVFKKSYSLTLHKRNSDCSNNYECALCSKTFKSKKLLIDHVEELCLIEKI